ncbi:CobW family GTP-binding protein [Bradyrhizobium sp.]|uniref:CobW family GTP-binding protein n=1 Tax=Bradyrhizobium sp. TaxID=376 RepID=UPI0039E346F7
MTSEWKRADEAGAVDPVSAKQTLSMLMGIFETARIVPRTSPSRVLPLTIISGFLGAGKTTLVNRLLSEPAGRRIAVLVNDFAAVNIDEELIRFQSGDTIGLTNGCACCSINGDLVNAIQRLVERDDPPDAVVLEASGIADPRGIAQIALANPAMRLDAIITLVDAETIAERLRDERTRATFVSQLTAADMIAVNKIDLVHAPGNEIRDTIESIAPKRVVLETTHGNIPTDVVLGAVNRTASLMACSPADHAVGFSSTAREWKDPVDRDTVLRWLRDLPPYIIRAKGTFAFRNEEAARYVYQRVGRREVLELSPETVIPSSESRVVLIGFSDSWKDADISGPPS